MTMSQNLFFGPPAHDLQSGKEEILFVLPLAAKPLFLGELLFLLGELLFLDLQGSAGLQMPSAR